MIRTTRWTAWTLTALLAACAPSTSPNVEYPDDRKIDDGRETPIGDTGVKGAWKPAADSELAALVKGNNRFASDLYAEWMRTSQDGDNFAFSPASISLALAMTYAGADGVTAQQMHDTLRFTEDADTTHRAFGSLLRSWQPTADQKYDLAVANKLFGERTVTFKGPFVDTTRDHYAAPIEVLDFKKAPESGRVHINDWVADNTKDRIKDLIPEGAIKDSTRLVLANAIYFKGDWQRAFDEDATRDEAFHAKGGDQQVRMMNDESRYVYAEADGMKLVELPYKGDRMAMTILLPDANDGLADLEQKLTSEALDGWLAKASSHKVRLSLPRFEMTGGKTLKEVLSPLGMGAAFEARGDFLNIADVAPEVLKIDEVFHKAFVLVNEKGTEAAAATAVVVVGITSVQPVEEVKVFRADHPFVFLIRDRTTGSILFMGRVASPKA